MNAPKMRTQAPLTPEQIRAVLTAHKALVRRRRYVRVRAVVRILFWLLVAALLIKCFTMIDDYHATCETLGQVCSR